jgi:type-F conjugative transfer system pilin assembly protein TrbC
MKKILLAIALAMAPLPAPSADLYGLSEKTVGSGIKAEDLARIRASATAAAQNAQDSLAAGVARYGQNAANIARRVDDIADATIASERDAVLRLIGIDPAADNALYYFVSTSMPEELLRAYVIDAMWTGGTLVFRGVPPDRTLGEFVTKDLKNLIYGKGMSAMLSIDPRLFDLYQIKTVPSIVLSTDRTNVSCVGNQVSFRYRKESLAYRTCPPQDPNKYWKMEGAVTSYFALTEFKRAGAGAAADKRLAALSRGLGGRAQPQAQIPFRGDWKDAISPAEILAGKKALENMQNSPGAKAPQP